MKKKLPDDIFFPISDTIPGPNAIEGEMLNADDLDKIPVLRTRMPIQEFGYGTAQDISSTSLTPDDDDEYDDF